MIYTYSEDGNISKYSQGISYIIEYRCSYKVEGVETVKLPYDKHIHLACATEEDIERYIQRYEELVMLENCGAFNPMYKRMCIRGNDGGLYTYWSRRVIKINPDEDYHFYANSKQEKELLNK